MSVGDCFDNALIESFWARMQVELLDRRRWRTRIELANAIFEYLEIFHNRQRRHTALGIRSPVEYERTTGAAADPSELTPQNPVTISPRKRGNSRTLGGRHPA